MVLVLAHIWAHSQGTLRVTDSRTGSLKLSCSTLQVTGLPSVWLEGIAIKKLVTVYVPGCCPGTRLSLVFPSRCDQETWAGGRPSLETQRATGTGSGPSGLSGTSSASALFSGWAADKSKKDWSVLACGLSANSTPAEGGSEVSALEVQVQILAPSPSCWVAMGMSVLSFFVNGR